MERSVRELAEMTGNVGKVPMDWDSLEKVVFPEAVMPVPRGLRDWLKRSELVEAVGIAAV